MDFDLNLSGVDAATRRMRLIENRGLLPRFHVAFLVQFRCDLGVDTIIF